MIGLAGVLDIAKPGDRVLLTSYGSGAGSDSFDITVTEEINQFNKQNAQLIDNMVKDKQYISYGVYAKETDLLYWE